MMMQEKFDDENHRLLNYKKIDRCQDNNSIDNDEYYRQILYSNEYFYLKQDIQIKFNRINYFYLILLIILFLTSQTNALPIYQPYIQQTQSNLPIARVQLTDRSVYSPQSFNVYRRYPNPIQQKQVNQIPSYSNGANVQIYDQTNFNNQQQSLAIMQNQQLKRERQRRAMIEKIFTIFDEDGNGQLTKDELYSMALRSNMFPKFHHYLKQT